MAMQTGVSSRCSCGAVVINTVDMPICRAFCHCTICREFNKTDYADVSVFHAKNVEPFDENKIEFKFYKKPKLVSRGCCIKCKNPVIEKVNIPLMPKLLIIPSANFIEIEKLPDPLVHIFYDKRVVDVEDDLKKHQGFVSSQLAFSTALITNMIKRS